MVWPYQNTLAPDSHSEHLKGKKACCYQFIGPALFLNFSIQQTSTRVDACRKGTFWQGSLQYLVLILACIISQAFLIDIIIINNFNTLLTHSLTPYLLSVFMVISKETQNFFIIHRLLLSRILSFIRTYMCLLYELLIIVQLTMQLIQ